MKDLDLSQLFCEILSGLAALALAVGLLDLTGVISLPLVAGSYADKLTLASLTGALILSYLVGVLVDALGLTFDGLKVVEHHLLPETAEATAQVQVKERKFLSTASEHLFAYRKEQWTYYSCYRNLFMLALPGVIVWAGLAVKYVSLMASAITAAGGIVLEVVLWKTMKAMLDLYRNKIPDCVS